MPHHRIAFELPRRTPLRERIELRDALELTGQPTWPEPLLGTLCGDCAFFDTSNVAKSSLDKGRGYCRRATQIRGGMRDVQIYRGYIACSEFTDDDLIEMEPIQEKLALDHDPAQDEELGDG